MQDIHLTMPRGFCRQLVSGAAVRSAKKDAREQRQMDDGSRHNRPFSKLIAKSGWGSKIFMEDRGLLGADGCRYIGDSYTTSTRNSYLKGKRFGFWVSGNEALAVTDMGGTRGSVCGACGSR